MPIYDVGVIDDHVYLVMEWVRGHTLRAWANVPHTPREIVVSSRSTRASSTLAEVRWTTGDRAGARRAGAAAAAAWASLGSDAAGQLGQSKAWLAAHP